MRNTDPRTTTELAQEAFLAASHDVIKVAEMTNTPILVWEGNAVKAIDLDEARRRLKVAEENARRIGLEPEGVEAFDVTASDEMLS